MQAGLNAMSSANRRRVFSFVAGPYELTLVRAGEVEAVHRQTTDMVYKQHLVPVEGQTDVVTMGLPYLCPDNVDSIMNPILVMVQGLGDFFNLYRGKPVVRRGGVLIMSHPTPWEFHPVHHPSHIDFFEQVLADGTDLVGSRSATRSSTPKTSGTGTCTARATRTTACTRSTYGTGGARNGAPRKGDRGRRRPPSGSPPRIPASIDPAGRVGDGQRRRGAHPTITHLHNPPILMADVS